jgi:predicted nuclease of predicted toxin-antitoxin system
MKGFLLDENLPASLRLPTPFSTCHVTQISQSPSDTRVWDYAREKSLVIVTKDADFTHRVLSSEPPPWVVHIRLGNVRLLRFVERLTSTWPTIESLLPRHKLITVLPDRVEAIE